MSEVTETPTPLEAVQPPLEEVVPTPEGGAAVEEPKPVAPTQSPTVF